MEQKLNAVIEKLRGDFQVPSIMASVFKEGKTLFCGGGLADVEKKIAATPDTVYAIASASKTFIATALCILADEKRLSLDDPVRKHLPDFEMYDPYMTAHLTVRDALGHRSGLPRHDMMWLNLPEASIHDIVRRMRYLPPSFEPRYRMHYQNHMFALASVLVERLCGGTWQDFLQQRILGPLNMEATYTKAKDYREKGWETESQPYKLMDGKVVKVPFNTIDNVGCAGCISSTVRDLDRWARLQLGKGTFQGKAIYSEAMTANLHSPQMIIKEGEMFAYAFPECTFTAYGQGWFVESYRGRKFVHHGGTIDGYKSLVGFLPDDGVAFSILTNLDQNQSPAALGYIICDMALGLSSIDWGDRFLKFMDESKKKLDAEYEEGLKRAAKASPPTHPLADYTGAYAHDGYGTLLVELEDGKLFTHVGTRRSPILPAGYDHFLLDLERQHTLVPTRFDDDQEGRIVKLAVKFDKMADFIEFTRQGS